MRHRKAEQPDAAGAASASDARMSPLSREGPGARRSVCIEEVAGARNVTSPTALSLRLLAGGVLHRSRRGGRDGSYHA